MHARSLSKTKWQNTSIQSLASHDSEYNAQIAHLEALQSQLGNSKPFSEVYGNEKFPQTAKNKNNDGERI